MCVCVCVCVWLWLCECLCVCVYLSLAQERKERTAERPVITVTLRGCDLKLPRHLRKARQRQREGRCLNKVCVVCAFLRVFVSECVLNHASVHLLFVYVDKYMFF